MDESFRDELLYFTVEEFANRVLDGGQMKEVSFADLQGRYAGDSFSPVDGKLVRAADHIAAFVEADASIRFGVSSAHLLSGRRKILDIYREAGTVNGVDVFSLLAEFQEPGQLSLF